MDPTHVKKVLTRLTASPDRRTQEGTGGGGSGSGAGTVSEDRGAAAAASGGSQATVRASSQAERWLASGSGGSGEAHPADPADLHEQGPVLVQPSSACPPGLACPPRLEFQGETPAERRSLPPAGRSRDAGQNLQMAQMMNVMRAMYYHCLTEVKSDVGRLQQAHNPFPYRPVNPRDDDDEDDDMGGSERR